MMSVKQKRRASCLLWTKDDKDETSASLTFDRDLFLLCSLSFLSFVSTNHDLMIPVTLSCHILSLFRGLASGIIPLIISSLLESCVGWGSLRMLLTKHHLTGESGERRDWLKRKETEVSLPNKSKKQGKRCEKNSVLLSIHVRFVWMPFNPILSSFLTAALISFWCQDWLQIKTSCNLSYRVYRESEG